MKNIHLTLIGVLALMLLSFITQPKQVVRLKNGNYLLTNAKIEKSDVEALQEEMEQMAIWLQAKNEGDHKKEGTPPKFDNLLIVFENKKGWKNLAAFGAEDQHYAFENEVSSNVVDQSFYYQYDGKESFKDESFMVRIEDIMHKYL